LAKISSAGSGVDTNPPATEPLLIDLDGLPILDKEPL